MIEMLNNDEDVPTPSVALSIPLNSATHNLDGAAAFDISKSWSVSDSIRVIRKSPYTIDVEVDVYNFGLADSYATVVLLIHYLEDFASANFALKALLVDLLDSVEVPAVTAFGPGSNTAIFSDVTLPVRNIEITHVYAVAFDPLFDPLPDEISGLLRLEVDFADNPSRLTRHVGVREVFSEGLSLGKTGAPPEAAFFLDKSLNDKGGPQWFWGLVNYTISPPDVALISYPDQLAFLNLYIRQSKDYVSIDNLQDFIRRPVKCPARFFDVGGVTFGSSSDFIENKWFGNLNSISSEQFHANVSIEGKKSGWGNTVDVSYKIYSQPKGDYLGDLEVRFLRR